jgi:hypothetical protein
VCCTHLLCIFKFSFTNVYSNDLASSKGTCHLQAADPPHTPLLPFFPPINRQFATSAVFFVLGLDLQVVKLPLVF